MQKLTWMHFKEKYEGAYWRNHQGFPRTSPIVNKNSTMGRTIATIKDNIAVIRENVG